jgi:hypothetical protein
MSTPFWLNEPTILLNQEFIFELWPSTEMCFEKKMNAISRLVILLTLVGFLVTFSLRILFVGITTLVVIVLLYNSRKKKTVREVLQLEEPGQGQGKEGFLAGIGGNDGAPHGNGVIVNPETLEPFLRNEFKVGDSKNPFSNVLLTEIADEPKRKSAPPSFNPDVETDIIDKTKQTVQMLNPTIKDTDKQLFGSLIDKFDLDQCLRPFHSTPNTRVANDQGAFAQWLYGDLKYSAKESTPEGAIAREEDAYRYTLY